jgi:hypothetical protein
MGITYTLQMKWSCGEEINLYNHIAGKCKNQEFYLTPLILRFRPSTQNFIAKNEHLLEGHKTKYIEIILFKVPVF